MLVRTANREDPVQTVLQKQSDLSLHYLPWPFMADNYSSFRNF